MLSCAPEGSDALRPISREAPVSADMAAVKLDTVASTIPA